MPAAVVQNTPAKRILAETTNTRANIVASPHSAKKRKLEDGPHAFKTSNSKPGSSQPKSQFEEQLEKLSQDINGLRKQNSENDQQWARPPLGAFNDKTDSLCFQQIEAEEGTLHGGKTTVRLYGVTEVSNASNFYTRPMD